jgi:hypothetical protein
VSVIVIDAWSVVDSNELRDEVSAMDTAPPSVVSTVTTGAIESAMLTDAVSARPSVPAFAEVSAMDIDAVSVLVEEVSDSTVSVMLTEAVSVPVIGVVVTVVSGAIDNSDTARGVDALLNVAPDTVAAPEVL